MVQLHIEHVVADFKHWKEAFDGDPIDRRQMGVRRYRILRPTDNPDYAIIDLEFDHQEQAEALLAAIQRVWTRIDGSLIFDPQWQISEVVEEVSL